MSAVADGRDAINRVSTNANADTVRSDYAPDKDNSSEYMVMNGVEPLQCNGSETKNASSLQEGKKIQTKEL